MEQHKRTFILFILSIPVFFIASVATLYFISIQEWVETKGQIIPENETQIFLPENAILKTLKIQPGDSIAIGQVLAEFESKELKTQILEKESQISENSNTQKLVSLEIETLQALPPEDSLLAAKEQKVILEEKIAILEKRLENMQNLSEKGVLSKMEIEDTELKLNDTKQSLILINIRASQNPTLPKLLKIKRSQQELENLKSDYEILQQQLTHLNGRYQDLTIVAKVDGILISSNIKQQGKHLSKGTLLFQIATNDNRLLEINLKEKDFILVRKQMLLRFEPDAISVFEYDYFWGEINQIIPSLQKSENTLSPYIVYGNITKYGTDSLKKEQYQQLPFGSTGKVYIALGKKSLLLQLIGWN